MRLNPAARVRVPALRERRDDLPDLIRFAFVEAVRSGLAYGNASVTLSERALQRLVAHDWPGNHRELKLFAINALIFAQGGVVTEPVVDHLLRNLEAPAPSADAGSDGARRVQVVVKPGATFAEISADVERQYLTALFHAHGGDLDRVAVELFGPGANRRRVHLRMNQLGLRLRTLRGQLSSGAR